MVLLYVDNDLAASEKSKPEALSDLKTELCRDFEMTDLGPVATFLNIQIVRETIDGKTFYGMKQSHCIDKIVED